MKDVGLKTPRKEGGKEEEEEDEGDYKKNNHLDNANKKVDMCD